MVTTPKDELVCSIRELEEDVEEISANNIYQILVNILNYL